MAKPDYPSDIARITQIIETMFGAISWTEGKNPDFDGFSSAIRNDAVLVPSARPIATLDIAGFIARMSGLHADGTIKTVDEKAARTTVKVFGNIAVAIGGYNALFDGAPSRGVNAFLLVREADDWQIAGMAWDNETPDTPLYDELI